jgi:hypothetical protein
MNITCSLERRKMRGRPQMKWERKLRRMMEKNLTPEEAVNRQTD